MIRGVGLTQGRELIGIGFPVEPTSIHDDSAQRRAMPAKELCGRMEYNVCAMLQGTDHIGRTESIIYDQRYVMPVSHLCYSLYVKYITVRVTKCLCIDSFGVRTYRLLQSLQVVHLDDCILDTLSRERMRNQVIRPAVQIICCHDMVSCLNYVLNGVGGSCSSTCYSKSCYPTLKCSYPIFENALSRVRQPPVDVPRISQSESVCRML